MSRTPHERYGWEPFRVTCRLATPLSLNHPWLYLEGIIGHLIRDRVQGRDTQIMAAKTVEHLGDAAGDYKRALARRFIQHESLVEASAAIYDGPELTYASLAYFKRVELADFPHHGKVHLASGHFRGWMLRTVTLPAETATFYGCGQVALVRSLLADLTALGNDTRVGWGALREPPIVEPIAENWAVIRGGVAMRPIPTRLLSAWDDEAIMAWRSPYWSAESREPCAPPGARVRLRS